MIPILAAAGGLPDPQSPAAVGWVCIIGCTIIIGFRQVMGFVRDMKRPEGPERRDVSINPGVASEKALTDHQQWDAREHEKLWSKIGGVERGATEKMTTELNLLRGERHDDAQTLQGKLDKFHTAIGGLEKATEIQNQQLAQIQTSLARREK